MTPQPHQSYCVALIIAPEGWTRDTVAEALESGIGAGGCKVAVAEAIPDDFSNGWASAMLEAGVELNAL